MSVEQDGASILGLADEGFQIKTWDELKEIIADNDLASLKRKPSDIARYKIWTSQIQVTYGSTTNFLYQHRLHWQPLKLPSPEEGPTFDYNDSTPFADPEDYRILINDWPYGVTPDITHLVVWLKTPIPIDSQTGDLTEKSRAIINAFIKRTFTQRLSMEGLGEDGVLWFKNWAQIQSVRGLEHVHVLVRDVPEHIITEWIGESPSEN